MRHTITLLLALPNAFGRSEGNVATAAWRPALRDWLQMDCVSISDEVNDHWCQSICPTGECPTDRCRCGGRERPPSNVIATKKTSEHASKPQHQILQADCVAISDKVNDYWCQSICPTGQCPTEMCKCGGQVTSREKTPSHRLATKKTGRHRLHASTLKHKILPRDPSQKRLTSAAFVSRLREYRVEHSTLPHSMVQRYYSDEFMDRLREYREDHGDVDHCAFADGIQAGDGMTKSEYLSSGQGTCNCDNNSNHPVRGCYWNMLSGEGDSMQIEVRDKVTFCSEMEKEDCGGCPMPTNYVTDCTCPAMCESGGPQSETTSFCASSECTNGCPGLLAVEHGDCKCPASCLSAMAGDFGTDKYLHTVWKQCSRQDDACDNCDECTNFDPHCPAVCSNVKDCGSIDEVNEIQRLHGAQSEDCSGCDFCHGCPEWCGEQLEDCPNGILEPWRAQACAGCSTCQLASPAASLSPSPSPSPSPSLSRSSPLPSASLSPQPLVSPSPKMGHAQETEDTFTPTEGEEATFRVTPSLPLPSTSSTTTITTENTTNTTINDNTTTTTTVTTTVTTTTTTAAPNYNGGSVEFTMTASGSVSDFEDTSSLRSSIASIAGVDSSAVTVTVSDYEDTVSDYEDTASVIISVTTTLDTSATATEVQKSLSSSLGTAATASTALGVRIETAPTIAARIPIASPTLANTHATAHPSPSPSRSRSPVPSLNSNQETQAQLLP